MSADLVNQESELSAAMRIISDSYSAAETVNGAYELTQEKILNLYCGMRNRRGDFASIDALAYVVAKNSKETTIENARARVNNKSEKELAEARTKLRKHPNTDYWDLARKYDRIDHGGRKFVHQNRHGSKIIFVFSDQRKLEFELTKCSKSIRQWLLSKGTSNEPNEAIELPVLIEKIREITNWPPATIGTALASLESDEISMLYANHHLSQFRLLLVQEERNSNIPLSKVVASDIALIIQSMLDELAQK